MNTPSNSNIDFKRYYFYGTILNAPIILALYPFRTVKILQQTQNSTATVTQLLRQRIRTRGIRGLFDGGSFFVGGSLFARLCQFGTYDFIREKINAMPEESKAPWMHHPMGVGAFAGAIAGFTTLTMMLPFDVVSQQLTVGLSPSPAASSGMPGKSNGMKPPLPSSYAMHTSSHPRTAASLLAAAPLAAAPAKPKSHFSALVRHVKDEGGLRFLFRGYGVSLLTAMPFVVIFPVYEGIRGNLLKTLSITNVPPSFSWEYAQYFGVTATSGSVASLAAVFTSAPFDLIKTRIQTARKSAPGGGRVDLRLVPMARKILQEEGVNGFFTGMKARMWVIAPAAALNFVVFDVVRRISTIESTEEL
ncbi:uncharacterized protein VTP21DRAFT_11720 [Calcarisporiella thermophila]|uniref:uncharacterized protein n=1 Tax=Calcarisporiella thermophila TaxID=911321 RepID=UPI0037449D9D